MKVARLLLIIIALALISVPIWLIGGSYVRSKGYERGYAKISDGDTKQTVIDAMGQPEDIEACRGPIYSDDGTRRQCAETLIYYSFLEKWGVNIDNNNVVVGKYYNVSP